MIDAPDNLSVEGPDPVPFANKDKVRRIARRLKATYERIYAFAWLLARAGKEPELRETAYGLLCRLELHMWILVPTSQGVPCKELEHVVEELREVEAAFSVPYEKGVGQGIAPDLSRLLLSAIQQMTSKEEERVMHVIENELKTDVERLRELTKLYGSDVYRTSEYEEIMRRQTALAEDIIKFHKASSRRDLDLPD